MDPEKYQKLDQSSHFLEYDQNGQLVHRIDGTTTSNVKITAPTRHGPLDLERIKNTLIEIFLPTGYPHCVKSDYIDYQIFDSIQAFASSIANLFANRAVLAAVGVGDTDATSTSALFMKIIQDVVGRLATIWFAWDLGTALEPEAKKYRFMADLVNDGAILFDCITPLITTSQNLRVMLLCVSGLLRSCCGVLAGGSRAALTLHFTHPDKGSIADVNAKDQSQETVITLVGMLCGSFVVGLIPGEGFSMWCTLILLLALHLWTNFQAVSKVIILQFNRQRANIVFSRIVDAEVHLLNSLASHGDPVEAGRSWVTSPSQAASIERILEPDGYLRWYKPGSGSSVLLGTAKFGKFANVIRNLNMGTPLADLFSACDSASSGYVLSYKTETAQTHVDITVVSRDEASNSEGASSELQAWVHALLIARESRQRVLANQLELIAETRAKVARLLGDPHVLAAIVGAGWELHKTVINTEAHITLQVQDF